MMRLQLFHTDGSRKYLTHAERHAFPDFEPTLQALGVRADGSLSEAAPLAALREALFAPRR